MLHFHPVARVWFLSIGVEDVTLRQFFFINLYLFDSIFRGTVRLISCINMLKEFISIAMVAMEIEKKNTISVIIATVAKRIKFLSKTGILYIWPSTDKIEMTTLVLDEKKCCNPNKAHFGKLEISILKTRNVNDKCMYICKFFLEA